MIDRIRLPHFIRTELLSPAYKTNEPWNTSRKRAEVRREILRKLGPKLSKICLSHSEEDR
jgi:hypothetical protein